MRPRPDRALGRGEPPGRRRRDGDRSARRRATRGLPSFWSDQYGLRIQYVGHAEGADEARISGDPGERDFHVLYQRAGRPVAALTVNRPRELAALRRLIESGAPADASATDTHDSPERTTEEAPT